ncbi:MAG: transposase [Treponema sp.]|nr:transposase [Treponema sp.]
MGALACHIVCPAKRRRAIINKEADERLREIRMGIEARYEMKFLETGGGQDRTRFPAQSAPVYSPGKMARTIKGVRRNGASRAKGKSGGLSEDGVKRDSLNCLHINIKREG